MSKHKKISASDEAWESGELGNDPKFAKVFEGDIQPQVDEAIESSDPPSAVAQLFLRSTLPLRANHGAATPPPVPIAVHPLLA